MSLFDTILDAKEGQQENNDVVASADVNPDTSNSGDSGANPEPSWWWDKSTPGEGSRPDWLPDKYKSAEDVAKAYSELQKKLGSAPEQYDWSKGDGWVDLEYTPFQDLQDIMRSKAVPQDVVDAMLTTVDKYLNEFSINVEEERAALGENARERLTILNNWAKANFSEETYDALSASMRTASAVKAMEELRTKMIENNTTVPTGHETPVPSYTMEDIEREMQDNLDKYKNDPRYRQEIAAKIAKIADKTNFVDKRY